MGALEVTMNVYRCQFEFLVFENEQKYREQQLSKMLLDTIPRFEPR
jgi:hypothetical protein